MRQPDILCIVIDFYFDNDQIIRCQLYVSYIYTSSQLTYYLTNLSFIGYLITSV